jgi:hypothetical protein
VLVVAGAVGAVSVSVSTMVGGNGAVVGTSATHAGRRRLTSA